MTTEILDQWKQQIRDIQSNQTLCIQGAGTKAFMYNAQPTCTSVISTVAYHGIVDYEPSEMVVTVRSGTSWQTLVNALAKENQQLPFEPPFSTQGATVGGVVASGLAGPARWCTGGVADYVLGIQMINSKAELMNFGGRVIKNVAGFDLSRLMTGSMGSLGLITEVTFKVVPIHPSTQTWLVHCDFTQAQALCRYVRSHPTAVQASAWRNGVLYLRIAGFTAAIDATKTTLEAYTQQHHLADGQYLDHDSSTLLWQGWVNQTDSFFTDAPSNAHSLWCAVLPSHINGLDVFDQTGLAFWGGMQRWLWLSDKQDLPELFAQNGGYAYEYRSTPSQTKPRHIVQNSGITTLSQAIKKQFDPHYIFNPHISAHVLGMGTTCI